MIFMDVDPEVNFDLVAEACAASPYSLDELEAILWNEVVPACGSNLFEGPAPAWAGFPMEWLRAEILRTHRFGEPLRKPEVLRDYTEGWWARLVPAIVKAREAR